MTDNDYKEALYLAGRMSDAARRITGGNSFGVGFIAPPAGINNIAELACELEKAVDEYDECIRALMHNNTKDKNNGNS